MILKLIGARKFILENAITFALIYTASMWLLLRMFDRSQFLLLWCPAYKDPEICRHPTYSYMAAKQLDTLDLFSSLAYLSCAVCSVS